MNWERFNKYYLEIEKLGFSIDISRMCFEDAELAALEPKAASAITAMDALEKGGIANPDEDRMVGHYWLRNADLAPNETIRDAILECRKNIAEFAADVHKGTIKGQAGPFKQLLIIGIGGSALGPQFVAQALGIPNKDPLRTWFFDNTDPDGMSRVLAELGDRLGSTLAIVISKSGGTAETRNGMLEAQHAWQAMGLDFSKHAVAITSEGSRLFQYATEQGWLSIFPMWDWVGGRTSELAAVGLLPAALQGIAIEDVLEGAREMDEATREGSLSANPAALLAAMWYLATGGKGEKDMVILPYKDRLMLFSKYLQQLIMESLGKEKDLEGNVVEQGIAVYGNKGSTDQHAYVQQLREGVNNFFVTFIEVLNDGDSSGLEVEEGITSGDFLQGFYLGTREALTEKQRESITLTVRQLDAFTVGALIALYERAVGIYAHMVGINAYHQPGVEAGKKAAASVLAISKEMHKLLKSNPEKKYTASVIASELGLEQQVEIVFKLLERMTYNTEKGLIRIVAEGPQSHEYQYRP